MKDKSATEAFRHWFVNNSEKLAEFVVEIDLSPNPNRGASVQLDTRSHVVSICAWDNGNTLEIQIIDKESEEVSIQDGQSASVEEFLARLGSFLIWFESNN